MLQKTYCATLGLINFARGPPLLYNLSMIVTLTRETSDDKQTLGTLMINSSSGIFTAKTLELPWLDNAVDKSCIPLGTYECKWTYSPKFKKYTYEITNVPNRPGIRIHGGNYNTDTEGCVLLGESYANINSDTELDLVNSRKTVYEFEKLMNQQSFTLTIASQVTPSIDREALKKQAIDIINKL